VSDDFHRIDIEIDSEEKRIKVSGQDMVRMLQPHWLNDVEKGWQLISNDLEQKLPGLISKGIRENAAEEEARKQKIIDEYKAQNPTPQLKDQVQDMASGRYGWAIAIFGIGLSILGLALILNLPIVRNLLGG